MGVTIYMDAMYKGLVLHRNSRAFELYQEAKKDPAALKKLELHMKEVLQKEKDLVNRYGKSN